MGVAEAIIAITSKCNAKCAMCDLWQKSPEPEVEPSFYYNLPKSLTTVNITGGEPFLRKDIVQILQVVSERCKKVRPVISTNGFLTDRILKAAPELIKVNPRTAIRVSLDGIGETHDKIRGVKGGFEKAMNTLNGLKKLGLKDLGVGFTLVKANENQMMKVYDLSEKMGIQFTSTVAHSSPIFFGDQALSCPDPTLAGDAFSRLLKRQLGGLNVKNWFRAYFTEGVIDMLSGRKRKVQCPALSAFFFLDPKGNVYPCHLLDDPLGNLGRTPYDEIVNSVKGGADKYRNCSKQCWMTCTVAPGMRKNPARIAWWILKTKSGFGAKRRSS